jgi:hypothetical protein
MFITSNKEREGGESAITSFHRRRDTIKVDQQNRNYKGWAQTLLPSLLKMSSSQ